MPPESRKPSSRLAWGRARRVYCSTAASTPIQTSAWELVAPWWVAVVWILVWSAWWTYQDGAFKINVVNRRGE